MGRRGYCLLVTVQTVEVGPPGARHLGVRAVDQRPGPAFAAQGRLRETQPMAQVRELEENLYATLSVRCGVPAQRLTSRKLFL